MDRDVIEHRTFYFFIIILCRYKAMCPGSDIDHVKYRAKGQAESPEVLKVDCYMVRQTTVSTVVPDKGLFERKRMQ